MGKSEYIQCDIEYHIVWTTKYRYKVLHGKVAERCRKIIWQSCQAMDINILEGSIGRDYVHLMILSSPNISVSKIVQQLKERTSKIIMREYKEIRKRYCRQHMWSVGYFCRSVGDITKEMIKKYIESQEDEYEETFKIVE